MFSLFAPPSPRRSPPDGKASLTHLALYLFTHIYVRVAPPSKIQQYANTERPWSTDGVSASSPTQSPGHNIHDRKSISHSPLSPRRAAGLERTSTEEAYRLLFFKRHVAQAIKLALPTVYEKGYLLRDHVDDMGFLISGGPNYYTETATLSALLPPELASSSTVPVDKFVEWILLNISLNEHLHPPITANVQRSFSVGEETVTLSLDSRKEDKAVTSLQPPTAVSGLSRDTIIHESGAPDGAVPSLSDLKIWYCSDSYIYILKPTRFATVLGCVNCTIVLGPVACALSIDICENVRIVSAARQVLITNTVDSIVQIQTPVSPILFGDCRGLVFSPFASNYSHLASQLKSANLALRNGDGSVSYPDNKWDQPVDSRGNSISREEDKGIVKLMRKDQFYPILPPSGDGTAKGSVFFPIPPDFAESLKARQAQTNQLKAMVGSDEIDADQRRQLRMAVQSHFREWLVESGNIRQVGDLVRIGRETSSSAGSEREYNARDVPLSAGKSRV